MNIETINPATGKQINTYAEMSTAQAIATVEQAQQAHEQWRASSFAKRKEKMLRLYALLHH